jgi:hypothetical protein
MAVRNSRVAVPPFGTLLPASQVRCSPSYSLRCFDDEGGATYHSPESLPIYFLTVVALSTATRLLPGQNMFDHTTILALFTLNTCLSQSRVAPSHSLFSAVFLLTLSCLLSSHVARPSKTISFVLMLRTTGTTRFQRALHTEKEGPEYPIFISRGV